MPLPVTQEVASSSLVGPALKSLNTIRIEAFFIFKPSNNPAYFGMEWYGVGMD